jgi:lysophospholipase L1-like esterase
LHATATDRVQNFAIATGPVDEDMEAVFFLDFLTGTLKAAVLSRDSRTPQFRARYEANINADLARTITFLNGGRGAGGGGRKGHAAAAGQIQIPQSPNYLMVTGGVNLQANASAGRTPPGRCAVYVAETNTGIVMAYLVPWSTQDASANRTFAAPLVLWTADQFTSAVIRPTNE